MKSGFVEWFELLPNLNQPLICLICSDDQIGNVPSSAITREPPGQARWGRVARSSAVQATTCRQV